MTGVGCNVSGRTNLAEFQPNANSYEIDAIFNVTASNQNCDPNFCVGGDQKIVIGYDASTGNPYLDRQSSGYISFVPTWMFPCVATASLAVTKDI